MSLNYQKDPAAQVPTLPTGLDGVDSVVQFYTNGTNEIKNLLINECSIIFECSYCRSFFRSIINFVAHKRTICRSLQQSVRMEVALTKKLTENEKVRPQSFHNKSRRNPNSLRRVNLASLLGKHIQNFNIDLEGDTIELQTLPKISRSTPFTTFKDGQQIFENLPIDLAVKERIPDDRTVLVIPQDNSIRYREMQLRTRRNLNDAKNIICRELSSQDIKILDRVPSILLELADIQELRCINEKCVNTQAFVSIPVLVHHLAIHHQKHLSHLLTLNGLIGCFICGQSFETERLLQDHFNNDHAEDRLGHVNQRMTSLKNDNISTKRGNNRSFKRSSSPEEEKLRFRSISPLDLSERSSTASSAAHGVEVSDLSNNTADASQSSSISPNTASVTNTQQNVESDFAHLKTSTSAAVRGSRRSNTSLSKEKLESGENPPLSLKFSLITKRIKLSDSNDLDKTNEEVNRNSSTILNSEEARKIDKMLNSTSSNDFYSINKIDNDTKDNVEFNNVESSINQINSQNFDIPNENEIIQQVADKDNSSVHRQRQQRNRKPTKRFYNEEYVVDPTKHEWRSFSSIDQQHKKISYSYKSQENLGQNNLSTVTTSLDNSQTLNISAPLSLPSKKEVISSLSKIVPRRTKKKRGPKTNSKVKFETIETVNNSVDLESGIEIVGKTLSTDSVSKFNIEEALFLASMKTTNKNTPLKSMSEPPENGLLEDTKKLSKKLDFHKDSDSDETLLDPIQSHDNFVLPSINKSQLPSVLADSYRENLAFYTPRARRARIEDDERRSVDTLSGSSRRKQNLFALRSSETSDAIEKSPPPRPEDLTEVPVYLTEVQRDIFFAPLRPLFNSPALDGLYQCSECSEVLRCIRDGRRHMVSHLRIMRIRCSLCDAGAFFCSDMRIHLMFRHCDKLNLAPEGFVTPGDSADQLSRLVDPFHPGRVMYTSGKIVSWANPKAYLPDPRIEERILGKALPLQLSSEKFPYSVPNTTSQSSTNKTLSSSRTVFPIATK